MKRSSFFVEELASQSIINMIAFTRTTVLQDEVEASHSQYNRYMTIYLRTNELLLKSDDVTTIVRPERSPELRRFPDHLHLGEDADRVPALGLDPFLQLQGAVGERIGRAILKHGFCICTDLRPMPSNIKLWQCKHRS